MLKKMAAQLVFFMIMLILKHCLSQFRLNTGLTYGLQTYGHMFDIISVNEPIRINAIHLHFSMENIQANVDIYSKKGTWNGYENNTNHWTRIHNQIITSNSVNSITYLSSLQSSIIIPAQERQAFYIRVNGVSMEYRNDSNITGNVAVSDFDVQILTGIAKDDFIGSSIYNAVWSGAIDYDYLCDNFQMISTPGSYVLNALQFTEQAPAFKACYQIAKGYTCASPHISIIVNSIDMDQYLYDGLMEYVRINLNKDGVAHKLYGNCFDSVPCSCCGRQLSCVNEFVDGGSFESGIIYEWELLNGADVHALCTGSTITMNADIRLNCSASVSPTISPTINPTAQTDIPTILTSMPSNNPTIITSSPTLSTNNLTIMTSGPTTFTANPTVMPTVNPTTITDNPTSSPTPYCSEYVEINAHGDYTLTGYGTEMNIRRVLCFEIAYNYTCYNPFLTVITKSVDYDVGDEEYLRTVYSINKTVIKDYGKWQGGVNNRCDLRYYSVYEGLNGPLIYGNTYEIIMTIGTAVHALCNPLRTMDVDVTISCYSSDSPTANPSVSPTISTTNPTITPTLSTNQPSNAPTLSPSITPTIVTNDPTISPSHSPSTLFPTISPTNDPTRFTLDPTIPPSILTSSPTISPSTAQPTILPTSLPSKNPTIKPTIPPSVTNNRASANAKFSMSSTAVIIIIVLGIALFCVSICLVAVCAYQIGAKKTMQKIHKNMTETAQDYKSSTFTSTTPNNVELTTTATLTPMTMPGINYTY